VRATPLPTHLFLPLLPLTLSLLSSLLMALTKAMSMCFWALFLSSPSPLPSRCFLHPPWPFGQHWLLMLQLSNPLALTMSLTVSWNLSHPPLSPLQLALFDFLLISLLPPIFLTHSSSHPFLMMKTPLWHLVILRTRLPLTFAL